MRGGVKDGKMRAACTSGSLGLQKLSPGQDALHEGAHAQRAGEGEGFGQKRVGLFPVARVVALEQGVGIVASGPGQLRTVASLAAEDQRTLEVGHRLVEIPHGLRHEPQQPVSGGYATVHHGALP